MPSPGPGSELLEDPGRFEDRDQDCRADDRQDERHHLTAANTELSRQPAASGRPDDPTNDVGNEGLLSVRIHDYADEPTDDAANDQSSEGPMCDERATAAGW